MAPASHLELPIDASTSSGPAAIRRTLAVLEGTLSEMASQTAVAAESLRADRNGRAPASDSELATWWLDQLVRAALATRDTCRAARSAIDERVPADGENGSPAPPGAAA